MPDFWQFPTGSMGLGLISAIYQARFQRYQGAPWHHRPERPPGVGLRWRRRDGRARIAGRHLARRARAASTTWCWWSTATCSGSTARCAATATWCRNSRRSSPAPAGTSSNACGAATGTCSSRDREGWILKRMAEAVDGEFQKSPATDGHCNREHFFSRYPELAALVANMSDRTSTLQARRPRPAKVYAAYAAAVAHRGQPTVILAQTTKGVMAWGLAGANTSHQTKKLARRPRPLPRALRPALVRPGPEELRYFHPGEDSDEVRYLKARRAALGGHVPSRRIEARPIPLSKPDTCVAFHADSGRSLDLHHHSRPWCGCSTSSCATASSVRASCRWWPMRRAPSACRTCSASTASTRPGARTLHPRRTATSSPSTARTSRARFLKKALRGRFDGLVDCCRHRLLAQRRADAAVLHLLFDVRLPARADLIWNAADSQARGFLLARRRTHHPLRRGPAA